MLAHRLNILLLILHFMCAESCLNLHEDERQKPENWIPIAWMPIYQESVSKRPTQGYESDPARSMRLFHDCWRHLLGTWIEKTDAPRLVTYGDGVTRQTRSYLGGLLGDQQVLYITFLCIYMHYLYLNTLICIICI